MLQSMRENLQGPVAKVVVGLAIAAMVLFGVETLFVNSVTGSGAASVNGESIEQVELARAIEQQKQRLKQQLQLEDDSPMLQDDQLRQPALMTLIRQKALHQSANAAGMAVADDIIKKELAKAFTRDGKFDAAIMNNYIRAYGYTPATLNASEANAYVLRQLFGGLNGTEFLTSAELDTVAKLVSQKRNVEIIQIPRAQVEASASVTADEIKAYYDANAPEFTEPEKIALEYLEVNAATFADAQTVSEDDVRAEYEREKSEFSASTEYSVSHILLDATRDTARVDEVQSALAAADVNFAELAKKYSDDLGSKELGGSLGQLVDGAFPREFEDAVKSLTEGAISGPVKTDAGTHFIRLDKKTTPQMPDFDARRDSLTKALKEQKAVDVYLAQVRKLEELTFGATDLSAPASQLGLPVLKTPLFTRADPQGIATSPEVAKAIFEEGVYVSGQASGVIELDANRSLVVRITEKVAPKLKPLEQVQSAIEQQLKNTQIANALQNQAAELVIAINQGKKVQDYAAAKSFTYAAVPQLERTSTDVDFAVTREAFAMARPNGSIPVTSTVPVESGLAVIVLHAVEDGKPDAMPKEQRESMATQLRNQLASSAVESFENSVLEQADYKIK
jgi:peptidyl-prolyl cis-trans isomerase D